MPSLSEPHSAHLWMGSSVACESLLRDISPNNRTLWNSRSARHSTRAHWGSVAAFPHPTPVPAGQKPSASAPGLPSITGGNWAEGPQLLSCRRPPRDSGHHGYSNCFFALASFPGCLHADRVGLVSTGLQWYFFSVPTSVSG